MPSRLLLVDDNDICRIGVRALLAGRSEWVICGEATNGVEAIIKVQAESPDIVLLDLTIPLMNGSEAAAKIKEVARFNGGRLFHYAHGCLGR